MRPARLILAVVLLATPALARAQGFMEPTAWSDAVLFRDHGYKGLAVGVNAARTDLKLDWAAESLKLNRGAWELCSGVNFTGRCAVTGQSLPDLAALGLGGPVRSMRPAASPH